MLAGQYLDRRRGLPRSSLTVCERDEPRLGDRQGVAPGFKVGKGESTRGICLDRDTPSLTLSIGRHDTRPVQRLTGSAVDDATGDRTPVIDGEADARLRWGVAWGAGLTGATVLSVRPDRRPDHR